MTKKLEVLCGKLWISFAAGAAENPGLDSVRSLFRVSPTLGRTFFAWPSARREKVCPEVEFLPFRKLCKEKYSQMGIPFPLDRVPEATDSFCREYASRFYELLSAEQKSR